MDTDSASFPANPWQRPSSTVIRLPVHCDDVALTNDRHLLLASERHGMIDFCATSGRELSRWLPPLLKDGGNDELLAVASLSDGRAAVGLFRSRSVVLLTRCAERGSKTMADSWTVDRYLQELEWHPGYVEAHGDVLAVAEANREPDLSIRLRRIISFQRVGKILLLMNVRSGQRKGADRTRQYKIGGLAVTAQAVITASLEKTQCSGGCKGHVIDAHSLDDSDTLLWHHELIYHGEERLRGLCVNSTGDTLYAAVRMDVDSRGRILEINMANGKELQRFPLELGRQPVWLALCDMPDRSGEHRTSCGRTAVALCRDPKTGEQRIVFVYGSQGSACREEASHSSTVDCKPPKKWDGMDVPQLSANFHKNYYELIFKLTRDEVHMISAILLSRKELIDGEHERICSVNNTSTDAATILVDYVRKKDKKSLYCHFLDILQNKLNRPDLVDALTPVGTSG